MNRTRARHLVALFSVAFLLAAARPSLAAATTSTTTDPAVYVSDQFKTVATRVFTQLAEEAIERACPREQVICVRVAKRLAGAFAAALSNNKTSLTAALNNLFVDTSVAAAFQLSAGSVLPANPDNQWLYGVPPLINCVVANAAGHSRGSTCKLKEGDIGWMTSLFAEVVNDKKNSTMSPSDKLALATVWNTALTKKTLDPVASLRALAALATSDAIDRLDERVYLLTLEQLAAEGLNGGLAPAAYAYLVNLGNADDLVTAQSDILHATSAAGQPATLPYDFTSTATDATNLALVKPCSGGTSAYEAWVNARAANVIGQWRTEMLEGGALSTKALDALVSIVEACTDGTSDPKLVALRDHMALFQGQLRLIDFTNQYALPVLAGTAILDYVRTGDSTQLGKNIRALALYGSARIMQYLINLTPAQYPIFTTTRDVLRSCEFQGAELALGLPVTVDATNAKMCFSITDKPGTQAPVATCPAAPVAGQPCPHTPAPTAKPTYTTAETTAEIRALEDDIKPLESGNVALHDVVIGLNVQDLARALVDLETGDDAGATRALARLGADFLVNEVDALLDSFLGTSDASCEQKTKSESIFVGLEAACSLRVLLQGAYRPIADWYFQQGGNSTGDSSSLATSVYTNLIESPALDTTPIILNVGLGGTFVTGFNDAQTWGPNGYAAMTLLDKIGVAFYKYNDKAYRFETGPFVGGFLDALIRTAANDGTSQRYWLAGYTVGLTRVSSVDLGLEFHAGAAMPFTLSDTHHYGLALGGAVVVPFNFVFQQGGQ